MIINIVGIIIVIMQLIFLVLEIICYKDGQIERGLLMNILIVILWAILEFIRMIWR